MLRQDPRRVLILKANKSGHNGGRRSTALFARLCVVQLDWASVRYLLDDQRTGRRFTYVSCPRFSSDCSYIWADRRLQSTGIENLNKWYQSGDQAYIIVASAMVLVMVPGLGFLYSGLARRKSALSMIWACMGSCSIITFQWYFWGYSLAFSPTATNGFIGNLNQFGLMNTLGNPSPGSPLIPDLLYAFYQVGAALELVPLPLVLNLI